MGCASAEMCGRSSRKTVWELLLQALLRVTNIVATNNNIGGGAISDTFFMVSDQFDPALAGLNAGVGIVGAYLNTNGLIGAPVSFASTKAQMNYLTTGVLTQAAFGGPLTGFSLTTATAGVTCVACSGIGFGQAAFAPGVAGGVEQLVGAIQFTLGPQSAAVLPGSLILEEDSTDSVINAEVAPEPTTMLLCGSALLVAGLFGRRRK